MLAEACEAFVGKCVHYEDAKELLPLVEDGPALDTLDERHQEVLRAAVLFSMNSMDGSLRLSSAKLMVYADLGPSMACLVSHYLGRRPMRSCDVRSPCVRFSQVFPGFVETLDLAMRCIAAPSETNALYRAHVRDHGVPCVCNNNGVLEPYVFDYYLINGILPLLSLLTDRGAIDAMLPYLSMRTLCEYLFDAAAFMDAVLQVSCRAPVVQSATGAWFFVNLRGMLWDESRVTWYRDVTPSIANNLRAMLGTADPVDTFCRILTHIYFTSPYVELHVSGVFVVTYKLFSDVTLRADLMKVFAKMTLEREDGQRMLDCLAEELHVPPRKCLSGAKRLPVVLDKIAKMCNEHNRIVKSLQPPTLRETPERTASLLDAADAEERERRARTSAKRARKKKAKEARDKERHAAELASLAERVRAETARQEAIKAQEASDAVRRALTLAERDADASAAAARVAAALRVHHAQCDAETRALAKAFRAARLGKKQEKCVAAHEGAANDAADAEEEEDGANGEAEEDEFACPITCVRMTDPVLLVGDGHTYERSAIENWLRRAQTSPLTGAPLASTLLVPNHALKRLLLVD